MERSESFKDKAKDHSDRTGEGPAYQELVHETEGEPFLDPEGEVSLGGQEGASEAQRKREQQEASES
ncbi:hypothetical protein [Streptomyces sp. NPDC021356]|uniref:hypothetical protein n=1 Tax=Streptomyces sp. NPDC021356 TaxID=3154900 RepID=UPI0033FEBDD8